MKKLILSLFLTCSALTSSFSQLADGSLAPNFTVSAYQTWLNGAGQSQNGSYNLYSYLDAGYTVILDVSATWCGPCWNYHLGGALEDLYAAHGPAGFPGVSANTTDDIMVFWIDASASSADATMMDGSGSIGNWIEPTAGNQIQYPMTNLASPAAFGTDYNIAYFPTIYKICPNRLTYEVGQVGATALYSSIASCPPPASQPADAAAISFDSDLIVCGGAYTPIVTIQNNGTSAMTAATVTVLNGTNVVATGSYSGNLATYYTAQVTCTPISGFNGGTLTINVTTSGDASATNGTVSGVITNAVQANGAVGTVAIVTDQWGQETTWTIKNASGATIASGGPYTNLSAAGTTTQPVVNFNMVSNMCYKFEILDSYGDGINSAQYGLGSYTVKDGTGTVIASGGAFTNDETKAFKSGVLAINDLAIEGFNIYPNPASDLVNISFEGQNTNYSISLMDLQGRVISSRQLENASGEQVVSFTTENVAKGTYIVTVTSNGATTTKNVVIK